MIANSQFIQKMNRLMVLNYVRKNPYASRPAIAKSTGLSMASMTNITSYLIEKKLLIESGVENVDRVGRKSTLLRFCAESYGLICVHLDAQCIHISYTDLEGKILNRISINLKKSDTEKMLQITRKNIIQFIEQYNKEEILGISIAISGIVLNDNHFVLSTSLKLKNIDMISTLEKETGIPVFLDNVSLLRAVWCFCCSDQFKKDNMIFIDLENGIGACQFYNGEINKSLLGEIGHTTVEKNGEPCFCGNRGCLETMCSQDRIVSLYQQFSGEMDNISFDTVAQKYTDGNYEAHLAVSECAEYLGIGLANLVNLCKPSIITINVGDFASLHSLIEKAKQVMYERAYPALLEDIIIQKVNVGVENTIAGSAFHMCDKLFDISYQGIIE